MKNSFFATIARMKYIDRWALMRNARRENLSEHATDVAMIAHALCVIGNVRFGRALSAERAAIVALYHDAPEIITGDMPTPIKHGKRELKEAYREVEHEAARRLLDTLPSDLRGAYEEILLPDVPAGESGEGSATAEERARQETASYMRRLIKAADKLAALIKCIEEDRAGNREFHTAEQSVRRTVEQYAEELPEVRVFLDEFLPPFGHTLDELL